MTQKRHIPAGFEFALCVTALLWAFAAAAIAARAANGLVGRLGVIPLEELLSAIFLVFLLVLGFQLLDRVAARRGLLADALPLPRRAGWPAEFGTGAAVGWGIALLAVLPVLLSLHLHGHLIRSGGNLGLVLLAGVALLATTLAQELIFRGYPLTRLVAVVGPSWAAVLSSIGFAVALVWSRSPHSMFLGLVDGALLGVLLAMAWLRTHALWVGWGVHFALRAVVILLIGLPAAGHGELPSLMDTFTTGPFWLTGGGYGLDAALLTAPVLLAMMIVLYRATRHYAWHYTQPEIVAAGYEVTVAPPAAHTAMEAQAKATPPPLVQIAGFTSQSPTVPPPPPPAAVPPPPAPATGHDVTERSFSG